MEEAASWSSAVENVVSKALSQALSYAPSLLAALLILIAGWLLGRLARVAARRLSRDANRILDRLFRRGALAGARFSPATVAVLGEVVFWVVIFLAVTVAARVAGFDAISVWLDRIAAQLPNLVVGAVIIVAGYFVSVLAGEQVTTAARSARAGQSVLLGRLAQGAIFVTALIIGLDQIGVDVTFLIALFAAAIGAIFVGFSIAFGMGARCYVSNLIGARSARRELAPGTALQIGRIEGNLLEITATHLALETAQGRVLIPARTIDQRIVSMPAAGPDAEAEDG
ncbi:MAG: mechanosensitive ion channel family protein [Alphaproteobacteria bacterium]